MKKDIYSSLRRDWGKVKPMSIEHRDRTKYTRKQKHKGDYYKNV